MQERLHPAIKPMHDEGCQKCDFPNPYIVRHPRTGKEIDRFENNVCVDGAVLRLQAGLDFASVHHAKTVGERDAALEKFHKSRRRYFDHARYGKE